MRAIQYRAYGGPEVLKLVHLQEPTPGKNQVSIRVASASVNPVDWKRMSGAFRLIIPVTFPMTPGHDVSGTVIAVGEGVTGFAPGDRVHARLADKHCGAFAEVCVADVDITTKIPDVMSFADAAALPLAGMTALQGLVLGGKLTFQERVTRRVLIIGGSGGVGHLAVQIARAMGMHVVAVTSAKNSELVRSLGAHETLDYNQPDVFAGQAPFDVIYDCIAGDPGKYMGMLVPTGRYLSCMPGAAVFAYAAFNFARSKHVGAVMMKANAKDLDTLNGLYERGQLRVLIDAHFPLEQTKQAIEKSMGGRAVGKIVIDVQG